MSRTWVVVVVVVVVDGAGISMKPDMSLDIVWLSVACGFDFNKAEIS